MWRQIEKALWGKETNLVADTDLLSEIWIDRPDMPSSPAFDFPVSHAGKDRKLKIAEVREKMAGMNLEYHLLASPDDIMWLLNIRGRDLKYSPVLFAFAIIGPDQVLLFADELKIPFIMADEFDRSGIVILPYEDTGAVLSSLPEGSSILISPASTSLSLFRSIPAGMKVLEGYTLPGQLKAIKNSVETEHIGRAMIRDGVALARFFFWLEMNKDVVSLTECSLADKLTAFRAEQEGFLGESFQAIVACNGHAALPHYTPEAGTDAAIGSEGILLIDSGGQYLSGTTDITRTVSLGRPTLKQIMDFTVVLRGHIALACVKMPAGTKGIQLDILARMHLWDQGLNYGHGTGHGVGYCLNVHEGPASISPGNSGETRTVIQPGMLISNEPAVYREGEYGIRTENLMLCYEDEETEFGQFLRFETVSLCFIDKKMIDASLLTPAEKDWLNRYHATVYRKLGPWLSKAEEEWLREKTDPL